MTFIKHKGLQMDVCMLIDRKRNVVFKGQRILGTGTMTYDWSDAQNPQLQVTLFTPEMARKQQQALYDMGYETEIIGTQGFTPTMTPESKFWIGIGAAIAGAFLVSVFL